MKKVNFLARGAMIAALYATITIVFAPISYYLAQVRISEALTVLAYFEPAAIPGLFVGCVLANIYGGLGLWDILGGSFLTLIAAYLTWKIRKPILALLPPVVINAIGIAFMLKYILGIPDALKVSYPIAILYIGAGQTIAVYCLGYPLLLFLLKRKLFVRADILARKLGGSR